MNDYLEKLNAIPLHKETIVALKAERDQLRKDLEFCNRSKIATIHRHGEANAILEKLSRAWAVRLFCRALRKEAADHINSR